ncbi:MAG: alpha,alpha-trehalase [Thermoleophilaceae bacterium]|jgi:GH15 family glucan-1,4-alpha-glucosidase|nr:alpha,alpha-trehalase [Thermoleophilaceae bacterium]
MRSFPERSSYPPIAEYAFLSDCEVAALVAPSGNVEWLCLPRFDSPSLLTQMLDRDKGRFRFGPADVQVPTARRYLPGSMVLETTWKTRTGWLVVRDALCVGPWHHDHERAYRRRRAPDDWEADHAFVRTARCAQGIVELQLECEPVFDYGRVRAEWDYIGPTYHHAKATGDGAVDVVLDSDMRMGFEGSRANARTTLRENETAFVSMSWSEHGGPKTFHEAYERMDRTSDYWREWLSRGAFPDHPWRSVLERSALTLKALQYAPTGAIIAAPSTSLPRVPGGERNYDYRYTFIRDSAFTLWGAYTLGFDWEADDYFYFLADQADDDGEIQNMYGISGERELEENTIDWLEGYGGARPVRAGNASYEYEQHDVWGAILDAAWIHTRTRDRLPERVWPMVKRQVENAVQNWRTPDRGIWAQRGEPRHWTTSKVMCWVAADRGARLAALRQDDDLEDRWAATAKEIQEDVIANALDDRDVFCAHYGTKELDASVLLMPLVRFLPPTDHRVINTVRAIADELTEHGVVLRRRPGALEDDDEYTLEGEAFAICSWWMVSALMEIGEADRARELCERMLSFASPLNLYAENIDPHTGRHLGNFPHGFTHLTCVNALLHVIRSDDPAARTRPE